MCLNVLSCLAPHRGQSQCVWRTPTRAQARAHLHTHPPTPESFVKPWLSSCGVPVGCRPQSREVYIIVFFPEKQEEKTIKKKNTYFKADAKHFVLYWLSKSLSHHGTGRIEMTSGALRAPRVYFLRNQRGEKEYGEVILVFRKLRFKLGWGRVENLQKIELILTKWRNVKMLSALGHGMMVLRKVFWVCMQHGT